VPVFTSSAVAVGIENAGRRRGGEEQLLLDVADAAEAQPFGSGNADDRHDRASDQIDLGRYLDWHHRLKVEIEERAIFEGPAGVEVELERKTDEIADRVLARLCQLGGVVSAGRLLRAEDAGPSEQEKGEQPTASDTCEEFHDARGPGSQNSTDTSAEMIGPFKPPV
jgi:hypothetical protein